MKKLLFGKAWCAAIFVIVIWLLASVGIFYFTTEVSKSIMPFIIGFLFVYPVGTFTACLLYAENYGQPLILQVPMFAIVILEYFLLGFDSVEPNYIVMSLLAILFGCGIGKQFCDDNKIITLEDKINANKQAREQAEKNYKSIIDDK